MWFCIDTFHIPKLADCRTAATATQQICCVAVFYSGDIECDNRKAQLTVEGVKPLHAYVLVFIKDTRDKNKDKPSWPLSCCIPDLSLKSDPTEIFRGSQGCVLGYAEKNL